MDETLHGNSHSSTAEALEPEKMEKEHFKNANLSYSTGADSRDKDEQTIVAIVEPRTCQRMKQQYMYYIGYKMADDKNLHDKFMRCIQYG